MRVENGRLGVADTWEGWCAVPIPVVASFRKIKNLVKNHGVVAAALRNSTQLVSGYIDCALGGVFREVLGAATVVRWAE